MDDQCKYCDRNSRSPVVYQLGRNLTDPFMISHTAMSASVEGLGVKARYAHSCESHLAEAIEDVHSQGLLAKLEPSKGGIGRFGWANVRISPVMSLLTTDLSVRLYKNGKQVAEVDQTGSIVIDGD